MTNIWSSKVDWEKLKVGLDRYCGIMEQFHTLDISQMEVEEAKQFQTKFNGFYKFRRNLIFRKIYYKYFEEQKNNLDITFAEVLNHVFDKTGRIEASFSSKLLATINAKMPVWDTIVLKNLNKKVPNYSSKDRKEKIIELYNDLNSEINNKLNSIEGKEMIKEFDKRFPKYKIENIKKIDLILWQTRE